MPQHFGEKLRYVRQERGISQSELARRLHLTQHSFVTHMEAGRRIPSLEVIFLLAQVLDVSTSYLLEDNIPLTPIPAPHPSQATALFSTERLGNNVRFLRTSQGMTQVEATRRLQLRSQGYLSRIEAGKKEPSPELLLMMADLFGVSTDDLLLGNLS